MKPFCVTKILFVMAVGVLLSVSIVSSEENIHTREFKVWGQPLVIVQTPTRSVAGLIYYGPDGNKTFVKMQPFPGINSSVPFFGGEVHMEKDEQSSYESVGSISILVGPGNCEQQLKIDMESLKRESAELLEHFKKTKAIIRNYKTLADGIRVIPYGAFYVGKYSSEAGATLLASEHGEFGPKGTLTGTRLRSYTQPLVGLDVPDLNFGNGQKGHVYRRKQGEDYGAPSGNCLHAEVKSIKKDGFTQDVWRALSLEGPLELFREADSQGQVTFETAESLDGKLKYVYQNEGGHPILTIFQEGDQTLANKIASLPTGTKIQSFSDMPVRERGKFLWSLPCVAQQGVNGLYLKTFQIYRSFEKTTMSITAMLDLKGNQ